VYDLRLSLRRVADIFLFTLVSRQRQQRYTSSAYTICATFNASVTGEIAIISVKITMWHHLPRLVCASRYTASVCNENLIVWDIDICRRWRSRDYSIYSRYIDDLVLQWGRNWYLSRFNTTNEKIIVSRRNTRNLIIATKCDDNDKMRNHLYRDIDATLQFKISLQRLTIIFLFHHVSTSRLWKFNHKKYSIPIIWYINNIR